MAHGSLVFLGLVVILIKGIVGPNIREGNEKKFHRLSHYFEIACFVECSDLSNDVTYRLHKVWSAGNECGTYVCKKLSLPNVRNEVFAVAMKIGCVRWYQSEIKQTHCINLEPGTGRNYTECCHIVVCVEGR